MVDRIRQLLAWQQISPTQFADFIGVGRPVVSHILSERNKPSLDVVQRIIAAFPAVSLPWLLSGTGEMLVTAGPPNSTVPMAATISSVAPLASTLATVLSSAAQNAPASAESASPIKVAAAATLAPRRSPALQAPPLARFVASKSPAAHSGESLPLPAAPAPAEPPQPAMNTSIAAVSNAAAMPVVGTIQEPVVIPTLATAESTVASPPARPLVAPTVPGDAAALLPLLAEPGKTIRRIVIFYRDGSFADYLPEG